MRTTYDLRGQDRPGLLVALHGLTGTRAQADTYLAGWDHPEIGILAPDLRGHGDSPSLGEAEDFTPHELAGDVEALVRGLGLAGRRIHVLGVSLGATVALELLRTATFDTGSAVFIRPSHGAGPAPHLRVNLRIADFLRDDPTTALDRLLASDEYAAVARISVRAAAGLRDKVTGPRAAERAMRLERGSTWTAFGADERVATPAEALIVGTLDDPLHPLPVAVEWHLRIEGSTMAVLPPRDGDPTAYAARMRETVQGFLSRAVATARAAS